jgi:gamma-glutamyl hercynylcysteine S-oxide synthase
VIAVELRDDLAGRLAEARARTYELLAPVSDADLSAQHNPLMSPLVWDLAHIGNFEELWLVQQLLERPPMDDRYNQMFDAFKNPRRDRVRLALPDRERARGYLQEVRTQALEALQDADLSGSDPLTREGYVFSMVIQHEYQHNETMLATLQLMKPPGYRPKIPARRPGALLPAEMVLVEAGPFVLGTDDRSVAYDNERPAHEITLPAYWIDAGPVTNDAFLAFIEDGGYKRRECWSDAGWSWKEDAQLFAPQFWERVEGRWQVTRFGWTEPVNPRLPVQHVCYWEAEAYARWAGKRLPTEAEWEKAASWEQTKGCKRSYPWGDEPPTPERANLDQLNFGPMEVGAYPLGVSPYGCHQMIGDVWEWVATDFAGYPGFEFFPYQEYSEVFFGPEYKVLRGGSWATRPGVIRNTFRNWDYPIRRQIFSGFRCARDAE